MTAMRLCLLTTMILGAAALGCGGDVVGPSGDAGVDVAPVDGAPVDVAPVDAPRTCITTADCRPGEECGAREGCDIPSYCGPGLGRPCTDDLAPFCGCDGRTFTGSSTCPVRSYRSRGPCEGVDAGPAPGCVFPDGRRCAVGARCPAPDGCNTCACGRDGALSCTEIACPDGGPPPVDVPLPRACRASTECPSGSMCEGAAGCATLWTCVAARPCTADLAPFCGCDGVTFSGSSTCPGRQYQYRGACAAADAGAGPACAPQDARGEGACDLFLGYAWNGTMCAGLNGCRCVGVDCAALSRDPDACRVAHLPCLPD